MTTTGTGPLPRRVVPAPALVVVAAFSLNFGAALARTQFPIVGPIGGTLLRLVFASVVLFVMIRPRIWSWTSRQWQAAITLGVVLGLLNQLIYLSFDRIPIGVALTIEFLGPLTLALVQARKWVDAVWALLALLGVGLIGFQLTTSLDPMGVVLAAVAGVCWAMYILASTRMGRAFSDAQGLPVSMTVASAVAVPLGVSGAIHGVVKPEVLLVFLGVGIASSVIPYALELQALRTLPSRVFGTMQSVGPAAGAIAGFLILGQRLNWRELVALLLVSAATVGASLATRHNATAARNKGTGTTNTHAFEEGALHD